VEEQKEIFAKQVELDEKLKSKPAKVVEGILAGKLKSSCPRSASWISPLCATRK
jgi:translation elongation factor EF-Ts